MSFIMDNAGAANKYNKGANRTAPNGSKQPETWTYANQACRHTIIINNLSNDFFDKKTKDMTKDIGRQMFVIGNYSKWKMNDEKDMKTQINVYLKLLEDLKGVNITLPASFMAGILIERLPESWNDYKQRLRHKHKQLSFADLITHIIIEETNRKELKDAKVMAMPSGANLEHNRSNKKMYTNKKHDHIIHRITNPAIKRRGNCFVYGKLGHHSNQCVYPPRNDWVVDSGATRHICTNKDVFTSYTPIREEEELIYLEDSRSSSPVLGKGNVFLKLTSGKILALRDVLHVPTIGANSISVALLGKAGVKVSFESNEVIMTKDNVFVGEGYSDQGLFVLKISSM